MILVIILIWCVFNTVLWIKGNEPYHIGVHFLYIFFMFSDFFRFSNWFQNLKNIIHENLFSENYYITNHIKKTLWNNYKSEFKKYAVFNVECRKKDGWKVYIHLYSNYHWNSLDMEMLLFDELKEKVEISFIHHKFLK